MCFPSHLFLTHVLKLMLLILRMHTYMHICREIAKTFCVKLLLVTQKNPNWMLGTKYENLSAYKIDNRQTVRLNLKLNNSGFVVKFHLFYTFRKFQIESTDL